MSPRNSFSKYSGLLKYSAVVLFPVFLAVLVLSIVSFAGDSDKRKITPVVIDVVEYEVARAVLICPGCGFEVVTTRLDSERPCPECGEFLDVIEVFEIDEVGY